MGVPFHHFCHSLIRSKPQFPSRFKRRMLQNNVNIRSWHQIKAFLHSFQGSRAMRIAAGSYGYSVFNALRKLKNVLYSVWTNSYQQCKRDFFTSISSLFISYLLGDSHSYRCEMLSYCDFVLIFLKICDVEHVFMHLLIICCLLWKKKSSIYFLSQF